MITVSKEDYLKAILEAESEGETVISATLATWLSVSPPAVTMAVRRLKKDGLVRVQSGGEVRFIAPEHRGRGTPAEFLAGVESELARLGYRRMFGFVDSDNRPARWLYTTAGHEDVLRCRTRTILGRLMFVDGRGWLISGRHGVRPIARG